MTDRGTRLQIGVRGSLLERQDATVRTFVRPRLPVLPVYLAPLMRKRERKHSPIAIYATWSGTVFTSLGKMTGCIKRKGVIISFHRHGVRHRPPKWNRSLGLNQLKHRHRRRRRLSTMINH